MKQFSKNSVSGVFSVFENASLINIKELIMRDTKTPDWMKNVFGVYSSQTPVTPQNTYSKKDGDNKLIHKNNALIYFKTPQTPKTSNTVETELIKEKIINYHNFCLNLYSSDFPDDLAFAEGSAFNDSGQLLMEELNYKVTKEEALSILNQWINYGSTKH